MMARMWERKTARHRGFFGLESPEIRALPAIIGLR
jgi:hypothetical protein